MTGPFSGSAAHAALRCAHLLNELMVSVGETGFPAAEQSPALLAVIDQHAAGVRDSLSADIRPLTAIILGAYAEGVRDAAVKHGWRPPNGTIDWSRDDWVLCRFLAICHLARKLPAV